MEADKASTTALGVAYLRAYHFKRHEPKVFADSFAWELITRDEREAFNEIVLPAHTDDSWDAEERAAALDLAIARYPATSLVVARSAFSEQRLRGAIARGADQYVIVGAGMDTFSIREPELMRQIDVFEIDHPATQAFKRERVAEAGLRLPERLHFAPADFEQDTVASALAGTQFDAGRPSFFAWHGVTMYLTRRAIAATIDSIRSVSAAGSEVVFDYWDQLAFDPARRSRDTSDMFDLVASFGEPFVSGFDPGTLPAELAARGFTLVEDIGPDEQFQRYFAGRSDGMRPLDIARIAHARSS